MNRTIIVGRLTRDPDLRYTPNGVAVANFTVAVNRPFKSKEGEQEADFINCVAWRKQAENLVNYMKKGSQIGVDGRLQSRSYEGQDGKKVFVTEILAESIQFLESKGISSEKPYSSQQHDSNSDKLQQTQQPSNTIAQEGEQINIEDSDLPF